MLSKVVFAAAAIFAISASAEEDETQTFFTGPFEGEPFTIEKYVSMSELEIFEEDCVGKIRQTIDRLQYYPEPTGPYSLRLEYGPAGTLSDLQHMLLDEHAHQRTLLRACWPFLPGMPENYAVLLEQLAVKRRRPVPYEELNLSDLE